MAARNPLKAAINKQIADMTATLEKLRPHVMRAVGSRSLASLHAVLGSKYAKFIDIKVRVLTSPDAFYTEWLQGLDEYIDARAATMLDTPRWRSCSVMTGRLRDMLVRSSSAHS